MSTTIMIVEKYYHHHDSWSTITTVNNYCTIAQPLVCVCVCVSAAVMCTELLNAHDKHYIIFYLLISKTHQG